MLVTALASSIYLLSQLLFDLHRINFMQLHPHSLTPKPLLQVFSPVGNRVSITDLATSESETLPFQATSDISLLALSPSRNLLVVVDADGRSRFISLRRKVVLHTFRCDKHDELYARGPFRSNKRNELHACAHLQV